MSSIAEKTEHLKNLLEPIVGEITAKNYFSYCGIFKDDLMFGLYKEGNFYLRIPLKYLEQALKHDGIQLLDDAKVAHTKKYYLLPENIMNSLHDYADWFKHSLIEIESNKYISYYTKKQNIRSLPNMTYQMERLLRRINIHTIEDLHQKGAVVAFVEPIKLGIDMKPSSLFNLYGAICHQFVYSIPEDIKRNLLQEADERLYHQGFRKRFVKIYQ